MGKNRGGRVLKINRNTFRKVLSLLLIVILISTTYMPLVPNAAAEKVVSAIQLNITGERVQHAFGEARYDSKYYKKITLQVSADYLDGTTSNVTNETTFTSTDESIVVTQDGIITGNDDTKGYIIATFQNMQAAIEVNSHWEHVSGTYVLNQIGATTYGELTLDGVTFNDANLERVVREHLHKPVGTITDADISQLITLDADYQSIQDLTGLEHAVNIEELYLEGNQISDITPLQSITNLKRLWLGNNQVTNLGAIAGLMNLTELYVWKNQLTSLEGIDNVNNLSILDIHKNEITSIEPLSGLTSLSEFHANDNNIVDLNPLSNLTSLVEIELTRNQITDIGVFSQLNNLQEIGVMGNSLNAESLTLITQLQTNGVYVDYAEYDTTPVEFADANLERALSEYIGITTPLKKGDLQGIPYLNLSNKGITNLQGLENVIDLNMIDLSSNSINNIDVFLNLSQLNWVNVSRNPIGSESLATIQALETNENTVFVDYDLDFDPTPVEITDSYLKEELSIGLPTPVTKGDLSNVENLFLKGGHISSLKGLEHAKNLTGLFIGRNNITSIAELQHLDQLQQLDITGNPIDTSEGSETSRIIQEMESRGIIVTYDNLHFDATPISAKDPAFEYSLSEILAIPEPIKKGDLNQVTTLDFRRFSKLITRVDGIENASNLQTLFLDNHLISDLTPLSSLGQLTELHLMNNDITDLSPLLELTKLTYVDVRNNLFVADPNSPAGKIIATLQQRGVTVQYNLRSDAIINGKVIDGNESPTQFAYVTIKNNSSGSTHRSAWDENGEFSFKLSEGYYTVTAFTTKNGFSENSISLNQLFENRDGKLYVAGELKESLEVNLQPVTLKASLVDGSGVTLVNTQVAASSNGKWFYTYTNTNGQILFRLPDGEYETIWVSINNEWISLNIPFEIRFGKLYVNGIQTEQLELKLPHEALQGSVVDENGLPVSNAEVSIINKDRGFYFQTDLAGKFNFQLNDGTYTLISISRDNEKSPQNLVFEVKEGKLYVNGELQTQLEIKLLPVTMVGKLVDELGQPLANSYIYLERNNQYYTSIKTDSEGVIKFRLYDGLYRVSYVWTQSEGILQNIPFEIREGNLYVNNELKEQIEIKLLPVTLKGIVLDENGLTITNAGVTVEGNNGRNTFNTNAEGNFSFRLADGDYKISRVSDTSGSTAMNIPFTIMGGKLAVNGSPQDQLIINLLPKIFRGSIKYNDETPVNSGYISLLDYKNHLSYTSNINEDGTFTGRFGDGDYEIYKANGILLNKKFSIRSGQMMVNDQVAQQIDIKLGDITQINAVLKDSGQVIPDGQIIIGIQNGMVSTGVITNNLGQVTLSLQDGFYFIGNIIKNNQWINLTKPIYLEIRTGKLLVDGVEQQTLLIDINPIPINQTYLRGIVKDTNGPISNAQVDLWSNGEQRNILPWTDASGNFQVSLSDGEYRLQRVTVNGRHIDFNIHINIENGKIFVDGIEKTDLLTLDIPLEPLKLTVDVAGGTYFSNQTVSITTSGAGTIYYTLDGSEPTKESHVYTGPITLTSSVTLKYFAVDTTGNQTAVETQLYSIINPDLNNDGKVDLFDIVIATKKYAQYLQELLKWYGEKIVNP
jgi:Leucine-rich repeat (LRR) protein